MSKIRAMTMIGAASLLLSACTTPIPAVEVTRFFNAAPTPSGTISVEDATGNNVQTMEFRTYAAAVGQELQRLGFTEAREGVKSQYVARMSFTHSARADAYSNRAPVSVGVGGSTGSYGSGVGVGVGFSLGGKPKEVIVSTLSVQIRRRADNVALWEGRASTQAREGTPAAQPGLAAAKLANALFRDFPGQSGQTMTVK